MKRPPGIWFLLSAGVLWLSIRNAYGLKATEIIFKKTTTTTSTSTEKSVSSEQPVDEVSTEIASEVSNATTKSYLTGNPQVDYIYDPNLPRELNGYNLSSYPFYNTMPDNITFKCEGLHDGFYASIPHKCQVYHHCLSGIRYDFLCANYTAFDQTIFNCHFVSEVDCDNSQKYWHRNDALYQPVATSTTTVQPTPIVISPALTGPPRRPPPPIAPVARRRTPPRRRPQYDYYDDEEYEENDKEDYYEPPPRRRRKRPRPRPRPLYDDEYEEYEDRYERKGSGRRTEDRRREYEDDDKRSDEKPSERHFTEDKHERRSEKRKSQDDRHYKDERRREYEQEDDEDEDRTYRRRPAEKRRPYYERPRKPQHRPAYDNDHYDDDKVDDRRNQKEKSSKGPKVQPEADGVALVKPHGPSSVYNQPRMPPRVKPPMHMPKNSQKPTTSSEKPITVTKSVTDAEYYDDYEDEVPSKITTTVKAPEPETTSKRTKLRTTYKSSLLNDEDNNDNRSITSTTRKPVINGEKEATYRFASPKFVSKELRTRSTTTTLSPISITTMFTTTSSTTTSTTTTTTEAPKEPIVRVVKRPFLPSRGGNPYSIRGLQPVGAKALDASKYETDLPEVTEKYDNSQPSIQNGRQFPTPIQVNQLAVKQQLSNKPIAVLEPETEPSQPQPQTPTRPKFAVKTEEQSRSKPKVPEKNPLDINEDEYDVTLNDALNPTIPNLPVRNFPTGFGFAPDYYYNALPRQRYDFGYNIPPESFQPKTIKQRDETVVAQSQTYRNPLYNNQNFRSNPQLTQANAHGFYNIF